MQVFLIFKEIRYKILRSADTSSLAKNDDLTNLEHVDKLAVGEVKHVPGDLNN